MIIVHLTQHPPRHEQLYLQQRNDSLAAPSNNITSWLRKGWMEKCECLKTNHCISFVQCDLTHACALKMQRRPALPWVQSFEACKRAQNEKPEKSKVTRLENPTEYLCNYSDFPLKYQWWRHFSGVQRWEYYSHHNQHDTKWQPWIRLPSNICTIPTYLHAACFSNSKFLASGIRMLDTDQIKTQFHLIVKDQRTEYEEGKQHTAIPCQTTYFPGVTCPWERCNAQYQPGHTHIQNERVPFPNNMGYLCRQQETECFMSIPTITNEYQTEYNQRCHGIHE